MPFYRPPGVSAGLDAAEPIAGSAPRVANARYTPGPTRYAGDTQSSHARVTGVLVGIEGELANRIFRLVEGENRLGRAPGCQVLLESEWISREHASIVCRDGAFQIAPCSDRNPTLVNDRPLAGSAELRDRDLLRLGRSSFCFRAVD